MTNYSSKRENKCPKCGSANLIRQTGEDEPTQHYGRLKCGDCGKHNQWLQDPGVTLNWQSRATAIDEIICQHGHKINQWEREFLKSVREKRYLTEKQKSKLNSIGLKCLRKRICAKELIKNPPLIAG